MKKVYLVLIALVLTATTRTMAQHKHEHQCTHESCSYDEIKEAHYKANPQALEAAKKFEETVKKHATLKRRGLKSISNTYVIPVVFHVYGTDWVGSSGTDYAVTDAKVKEALRAINEDFAGYNDDIDPIFSNIEGGMNVEFKLAQVDPMGNTTTGIIHHEYKEGFGLNGTSDSEIARYAWDNYKYMNVHVQLVIKSVSKTKSGVAWFPDTGMSDDGTARVVYNGKYILYSPPASSLTHEFGHFFGLEHTFANGGCVSGADKGDYVADTPPTDGQIGCDQGLTNCFGNRVNYQNHMDYNPCESMFTKGQVTRMEAFMEHEARITLWQDSTLIATGVKNDLGKRVIFNFQDRMDSDLYKTATILESFENDGSIMNRRKIKAVSGAKFRRTGLLTASVDYTASNVPQGLHAKVEVKNDSIAEIYFTGNATSHTKSNSCKVSITLLDPSISGGVQSLYSQTGTYQMDFIDSYTNQYETFAPYFLMGTSNQNRESMKTAFNSFVVGGTFSFKLRNYDGNQISLDNYENNFEVLCVNNTRNAALLNEGHTVSSSGNWIAKSGLQEQLPVISSPDYSAWHGKTAYAGIRIPTVTNDYVYGWVKIRVSDTGGMAQMMTMGVYPKAGSSITTGINRPKVSYSEDRFLESVENNSTIGNTINVTLDQVTFAQQGTLEQDNHYKVKNVPGGLQFNVVATSATTAEISMAGTLTSTGNVDYKGWDHYRWNIEFDWLDAAFSNKPAADVHASSYDFGLEYLGETFSENLYDVNMDLNEADPEEAWFTPLQSYQSLDLHNQSYQLQVYEEGDSQAAGTKFISWRKDAVANTNFELTPLDYGTIIGPNSNWKRGREYYSGNGQHMIDSDTYQAWRGKEKFIGIRFRRSGRLHYGWIKMKVSTSGKLFEFKEYGICGEPDTAIAAGTEETGNGNDNQAPTVPANLATTGTTPNSISFEWTASTDNVGVIGYDVYMNNVFAGTTLVNNYTKNALTPETQYQFKVKAKDGNGNLSGFSNTLTATTPSENGFCNYCPSAGRDQRYEWITGVTLNAYTNISNKDMDGYGNYTNEVIQLEIGSVVDITLDANVTDVSEAFKVWIDYNADCDFDDPGEEVYSATGDGGVTGQFTVPFVAAGTTRMRVSMRYSNYPESPCSDISYGEVEDYTIELVSINGDTQAPSVPSDLTSLNVQSESLVLNWTASTDNVAVVAYEVYKDGSLLATTSTTSYQVVELQPSTNYQFTVKAKDVSGNSSASSSAHNVTTLSEGAGCNYCDASGRSQQYEWITNVKVNDFINASVSESEGYGNYLSQVIYLEPSSNATIELNTNVSNYQETFKVWIDYNKDCDFGDPGEEVFGAIGQGAVSGQFNVPENVEGSTRMRVSLRYSMYPEGPCNDVSYGEVEDYTVSFGTHKVATLVGDEVNARLFTLLPNPVKDILTIETGSDRIEWIEVLSVNGTKIDIQVNDKQVNVSHLPSGLYLVRVTIDGVSYVERFVKE